MEITDKDRLMVKRIAAFMQNGGNIKDALEAQNYHINAWYKLRKLFRASGEPIPDFRYMTFDKSAPAEDRPKRKYKKKAPIMETLVVPEKVNENVFIVVVPRSDLGSTLNELIGR